MKPDYENGHVALYCGDCLKVLPELTGITAVVSDPPYGCANDCDYTRFSGGLAPSHTYKPIAGDQDPFDPSPWLTFPKVALFGYQYFAHRVPLGTVLVWCKRRDNQLGKFLSDCELAWMKGGKGCYLYRHVWNGFDRESQRGQKSLHPSEKPTAVMGWLLDRLKVGPDAVVLDPYMGSGSTGLACRGRCRFVGIELDPHYFEIARNRLSASTE